MFEYNEKNLNLGGAIIGLTAIFTYFNQGSVVDTLAYCTTWVVLAAAIAFGITKIKKNKKFGIYFGIVLIIMVLIDFFRDPKF